MTKVPDTHRAGRNRGMLGEATAQPKPQQYIASRDYGNDADRLRRTGRRVGTTRLGEFNKLPPEFVATIRKRMIRAQLWTELDVCCDHWYVAAGVVRITAFWLDVLIAQGLAVRKWGEEEGQYRYWHVASAPEREQREDRVN
jgi:hypothetical protein